MIKTPEVVAQRALQIIEQERSGDQLGLKTGYPKLNAFLGKYLRFGTVTAIAGLSGHGKSYFLNNLIQDFLNEDLNYGICKHNYIIPYHCFEMLPEDDLLRTVSGQMGVSYHHLLSSEYRADLGGYNRIDDIEITQITEVMKKGYGKPIYYFDTPATIAGIGNNVKLSIEYYQDTNHTNEIPKVILPIDHTLLIRREKDQKTIQDLMTELAVAAITLKKKGYLVIFIGQLNNEIENFQRIKSPDGHYPVKSDIYAQSQIYNACDNVWTVHQPELLNISKYGKYGLSTRHLVHLQILKQRFGFVGSIWLKNNLKEGRFELHNEIYQMIKEQREKQKMKEL